MVYSVPNMNATMGKWFRRHCHHYGMQLSSCRFVDEGERVAPEATYKNLTVDLAPEADGGYMVYLDCMVEQIGGRFVRRQSLAKGARS
jgi:hypothetical protein